MKQNLFNNIGDPNGIGDIKLTDVIHTIKNNPEKDLIIEARKYGKDDPFYKWVKSVLQTFTPNAYFNGYRNKKNIAALTGLIYLDIEEDVPPAVYENIPFICASWKSFGGIGNGMLASISGLTVKNFTDTWFYLENYFRQYNLFLDKKTKDIARQNVFSYDPDVYVNNNCTPLDINQINLSSNSTTPHSINSYSSTTSALFDDVDYITDMTLDGFEQLRYCTVLKDYGNNDYIVFEEGKPFMRAYLPYSIPDGHRHKWLYYYAACILFNNPMVSKKRFEVALLSANKRHCYPKLEANEISKIADWMYEKHKNNQLVIHPKKKKIWFNPASNLSIEQIRSIVGQVVGSLRRKRTINKLIEVYIQLDMKNRYVTQKMLMAASGYSIRTVKKYWNEIIY
jgi:hypothetical protein